MSDQPEFHLGFFENGEMGVTKFVCVCGAEIIGYSDDRRHIIARPHCDNPIECPECGEEWEPVNKGVVWEQPD